MTNRIMQGIKRNTLKQNPLLDDKMQKKKLSLNELNAIDLELVLNKMKQIEVDQSLQVSIRRHSTVSESSPMTSRKSISPVGGFTSFRKQMSRVEVGNQDDPFDSESEESVSECSSDSYYSSYDSESDNFTENQGSANSKGRANTRRLSIKAS